MGRYRLDYGGLGSVLRSGEMRAALEPHAEAILEKAKANAPRGDDPRHGHYADHFGKRDGHRANRASVQVYNDSEEALIVEFGTPISPEYAPMRKALG